MSTGFSGGGGGGGVCDVVMSLTVMQHQRWYPYGDIQYTHTDKRYVVGL